MQYTKILKDIKTKTFRRQDFLDAMLRANPSYNVNSINRHFSKVLSCGFIENVGKNLFISVSPDTSRRRYAHINPSEELIDVLSFLNAEFPLADFIAWETVQLNEFFNHQIAENTIVVMVESILMDVVFERLKVAFSSVLLAPRLVDFQRYGGGGSIIVVRLNSRYPKNPVQNHGCSIEKLIVDLVADKTIRSLVNAADYPSAIEAAFAQYQVNETRLFNYAKARYVDADIRTTIMNKTSIKLYTDRRDA